MHRIYFKKYLVQLMVGFLFFSSFNRATLSAKTFAVNEFQYSPLALVGSKAKTSFTSSYLQQYAAVLILILFNLITLPAYSQNLPVVDVDQLPKKMIPEWNESEEELYKFIDYMNENFFTIKPVEFVMDKQMQLNAAMAFVQRPDRERNLIRVNGRIYYDIIRMKQFFAVLTHELAHGGDFYTNDLSNLLLHGRPFSPEMLTVNENLKNHREGLAEARRAIWHYNHYKYFSSFIPVEEYEKKLYSHFGFLLAMVYGKEYREACGDYLSNPSAFYDLWHEKMQIQSDYFYYSRYSEDNKLKNEHRLVAFLGQLQQKGFYLADEIFQNKNGEIYSPFQTLFFKKVFFDDENEELLLGASEYGGRLVSSNDGIIGEVDGDTMKVYLPIHHYSRLTSDPIGVISISENQRLRGRERDLFFLKELYDFELPEMYRRENLQHKINWAVMSLKVLKFVAEKKELTTKAKEYEQKISKLVKLNAELQNPNTTLLYVENQLNKMGLPLWTILLLGGMLSGILLPARSGKGLEGDKIIRQQESSRTQFSLGSKPFIIKSA